MGDISCPFRRMPYQIVREPRGAYKRFWGVVTPQEFLNSVSDFHNDPVFETIRYTINDFTDTERFVMDQFQIDETAAINIGASFTNPSFRVVAVTQDPVIIGMARKYDQLSTLAPIKIFPRLDEARAWLQAQGLMSSPP